MRRVSERPQRRKPDVVVARSNLSTVTQLAKPPMLVVARSRVAVNVSDGVGESLVGVVLLRVEDLNLTRANPGSCGSDVAVLSDDGRVSPLALSPACLVDVPTDLAGSPEELLEDFGEVLGAGAEVEGVRRLLADVDLLSRGDGYGPSCLVYTTEGVAKIGSNAGVGNRHLLAVAALNDDLASVQRQASGVPAEVVWVVEVDRDGLGLTGLQGEVTG